jgi:uncharacterized membrane protein YhiD involved in acid resistance
MNNTQTFSQFLATQTPHVDLIDFSINLGLTLLLTLIVALAYVQFGTSISNRKMFSKNLVIIAMTTMIIITVVKASLALSLGLVGALSIVRFRTPIKEPEELAFLFISIAIGLCLGAGQREVAGVGFTLVLLVIWFRHTRKIQTANGGMHLSVSTDKPIDDLLDKIISTLKNHASKIELRRIDETKDAFQSDFLVAFDNFENFNKSKNELRSIDENIQLSFLDVGN